MYAFRSKILYSTILYMKKENFQPSVTHMNSLFIPSLFFFLWQFLHSLAFLFFLHPLLVGCEPSSILRPEGTDSHQVYACCFVFLLLFEF